MAATPQDIAHHIRPMTGRDPHERGRVATPLELLFDLTFAAAFGVASSQFAHALAAGHVTAGLLGFCFASFAICWAWINFSWFSSAFDTDDWVFRLVTMIQMVGVLVLAVGLPRMFASIEHGDHLDNALMVLGYVIMRVAMLSQWVRAARSSPAHSRPCWTYAIVIGVAQIGWVVQIMSDFSLGVSIVLSAILLLIELAGPVIAELWSGGTPWHPHHIAERYGLFAVIAMGEGIIGSLATLTAIIGGEGWTFYSGLNALAGTGIIFGVWWIYYLLPSGEVLHVHRVRSFVWGYGQMVLIAAIVAIGTGLELSAYYIEHKAEIGEVGTVLATAIPLGIVILFIYGMFGYLVRTFDRLHKWLLAGTAAMIALAVLLAMGGVNVAVCLIVLALAPVVTIVGFEGWSYKHTAAALAQATRGTAHTHGSSDRPA